MEWVYVKDGFVPKADAVISIEERGFRFGDGVFETIRILEGVPYQWELHLARLHHGLKTLKINYPDGTLLALVKELLTKNAVVQGFVRLSISRGIGSQGYLPTGGMPLLVMETLPPTPAMLAPVNLWVSQYEKPSARAMPVTSKTMQGVHSTLARLEAHAAECMDAVILNAQGHVCEASSGNIFWVKDDILHTPSLETGLLPGTIRDAVIRLSPLMVVQGTFGIEHVEMADEVFLTNVSWLTLPVQQLKPTGSQYNEHETALAIRRLLDEDMRRYARIRH